MINKWFALAAVTAATLGLTGVANAGCNDGSCGMGNSNGNGDECCDKDQRFTISADLLVMKPCQDLPYLKSVDGATPSTTTTYSYAEYDWDLGFRLNGYYQSDCNGWDANVAFTWLSSDAEDSVAIGAAPHPILTASMRQNLTEVIDSPTLLASSTYTYSNEMDYWTVDALIGHRCCICPGFELRPYGGFRALSVEQESTQIFADTALGVVNVTGYLPTAKDGVTHKIEYQAYGLTGGFEGRYSPCDLGCGNLSIFAKAGGSVVAGDRDHLITDKQSTTNAAGAVASSVSVKHILDSKCQCAFGYELALGLDWETCTCGWTWGLGAGYEFNHWSDVGNPLQVSNDELALQGFVVRGHFTF